MHARNLYKDGINIKNLIESYPEIKSCCFTSEGSVTGKFDFTKPENSLILTRCLLRRDFNINIEFHPCRLVPILPLRLNYILWIEDLLISEGINLMDQIIGFDVGCGATCIYPLLSIRMHPLWRFYAIENDVTSRAICLRNIVKNSEGNQIVLCEEKPGLLESVTEVLSSIEKFTVAFTMCNPPFFSFSKDKDEFSVSEPFYSVSDRCTEGGEIKFVQSMVDESLRLGSNFQNAVIWFTSMIGCKSSVSPLVDYIEASIPPIQAVRFQSFTQGRKTRWFVAWSFVAEPSVFDNSKYMYIIKTLENINFNDFFTNLYNHIIEITTSTKLVINDNQVVMEGFIDINVHKWTRSYRRKKQEIPALTTLIPFKIVGFLISTFRLNQPKRVVIKMKKANKLDGPTLESFSCHTFSFIRKM